MQQDAGNLKGTVLENVHSYIWDAMCLGLLFIKIFIIETMMGSKEKVLWIDRWTKEASTMRLETSSCVCLLPLRWKGSISLKKQQHCQHNVIWPASVCKLTQYFSL